MAIQLTKASYIEHLNLKIELVCNQILFGNRDCIFSRKCKLYYLTLKCFATSKNSPPETMKNTEMQHLALAGFMQYIIVYGRNVEYIHFLFLRLIFQFSECAFYTLAVLNWRGGGGGSKAYALPMGNDFLATLPTSWGTNNGAVCESRGNAAKKIKLKRQNHIQTF